MQAQAVVEVMGGFAALHAPVRGLADLRAEIAKGLPVAALQKTVEHVYPNRGPAERKRLLYRIVAEGSYRRRSKAGRLTAVESERTARLAHVIALAEDVWRDRDGAREFLTAPHPELGGQAPIEVAVEDFGAREVEEILWGIRHGFPA